VILRSGRASERIDRSKRLGAAAPGFFVAYFPAGRILPAEVLKRTLLRSAVILPPHSPVRGSPVPLPPAPGEAGRCCRRPSGCRPSPSSPGWCRGTSETPASCAARTDAPGWEISNTAHHPAAPSLPLSPPVPDSPPRWTGGTRNHTGFGVPFHPGRTTAPSPPPPGSPSDRRRRCPAPGKSTEVPWRRCRPPPPHRPSESCFWLSWSCWRSPHPQW